MDPIPQESAAWARGASHPKHSSSLGCCARRPPGGLGPTRMDLEALPFLASVDNGSAHQTSSALLFALAGQQPARQQQPLVFSGLPQESFLLWTRKWDVPDGRSASRRRSLAAIRTSTTRTEPPAMGTAITAARNHRIRVKESAAMTISPESFLMTASAGERTKYLSHFGR